MNQESEEEGCRPCPAGEYCAGFGLNETSGNCSEGFYCIMNSTTSTPVDSPTGSNCPPGFYCPEGEFNSKHLTLRVKFLELSFWFKFFVLNFSIRIVFSCIMWSWIRLSWLQPLRSCLALRCWIYLFHERYFYYPRRNRPNRSPMSSWPLLRAGCIVGGAVSSWYFQCQWEEC